MMDRGLPREILEQILSPLPLVDVFRLRRVSQRFDRFLLPRLTTLQIDYVEFRWQIWERGIGLVQFSNVIGRILGHYGPSVKTLKLNFFQHELEMAATIANCCPKLTWLELFHFDQTQLHNRALCEFPVQYLFKLPALKVLKADLCLNGFLPPEVPRLQDRLAGLEEISSVSLKSSDAWFLEIGRFATCLKEIVLHDTNQIVPMEAAGNVSAFLGLESVKFFGGHAELVTALQPGSLKRLHFAQLHQDFEFSSTDLLALSSISQLKEFVVFDSDAFPNYAFLGNFAELESVIVTEFGFDVDAFACIPAKAPLRHVKLDWCAAVVALGTLLEVIELRGYALETVCLDGDICDDFPEHLLSQFLAKLSSSLRRVALRFACFTDASLEQMSDELITGLSYLDMCRTSVTAAGVRGWLERRKALVEECSLAGGSKPPLLCLLLDDELLVEGCRGYEGLSGEALVVLMRWNGHCYVF